VNLFTGQMAKVKVTGSQSVNALLLAAATRYVRKEAETQIAKIGTGIAYQDTSPTN